MVALSFVIPMYRSEESIERLLDSFASLSVAGGYELVLVNDGSPDDLYEKCRSKIKDLHFPIQFINLTRNFGEHNAVMAGLRKSRGQYVVIMDDDLQNSVADALRLFEYAQAGNFDVVYSRYEEKHHSLFRNMGSWLTNQLLDRLIEKQKGLYLSSFKCIHRIIVDEILRYDGPFPYIDGLLIQVVGKIGVLTVEHHPRLEGTSGYNLRRLLHLWAITATNFSIVPLRYAAFIGLIMASLGILGVLGVLFEYFYYGHIVTGWASLMVCMLVFGGTQLVCIGIIGEYLGRTFLTINRKPQYSIREVIQQNIEPS